VNWVWETAEFSAPWGFFIWIWESILTVGGTWRMPVVKKEAVPALVLFTSGVIIFVFFTATHRRSYQIDARSQVNSCSACHIGLIIYIPILPIHSHTSRPYEDPPWLALPPLDAISRTSSLGLVSHCQLRPCLYGMDNSPVGKVAGVGVMCRIVGRRLGAAATAAAMAGLAALGCSSLHLLSGTCTMVSLEPRGRGKVS
jgi:hypothetical protein